MLILLGFILFGALWLRAKILGKKMNSYVKMKTAEAYKAAQPESDRDIGSGPVLDAHETPDGWSVDND